MAARKGISLPIEMIVVIAIAVLVLVVIAAFFVGGAGQLSQVQHQQAFAQGCNALRFTYNCNEGNVPATTTGAVGIDAIIIPNYKPLGVTSDQSLSVACTNIGYGTANACKTACGCPSG